MKKQRFIPLDLETQTSSHLKRCDKEGCEHIGEFRAPKSRRNLREYYWFCMDHIREYNKAWDFYKDMSPEEIEESRYSDITWNRPSWPIGGWHTLLEHAKYFDGLDSFIISKKQATVLPKPIQKALDALLLTYPFTMEGLKKQYKKLVKQYHPDLHPNNKHAEERLKDVNQAYQVLKKFLEG